MTARHYRLTVIPWLAGWLSWLWTPESWLVLLFVSLSSVCGVSWSCWTYYPCKTWFTAEKSASASASSCHCHCPVVKPWWQQRGLAVVVAGWVRDKGALIVVIRLNDDLISSSPSPSIHHHQHHVRILEGFRVYRGAAAHTSI